MLYYEIRDLIRTIGKLESIISKSTLITIYLYNLYTANSTSDKEWNNALVNDEIRI